MDFCSRKGTLILNRISMIPGILLFFYRPPLFMGTRGKNLNESKVHFIHREFTFFCTRSELKYHEHFHERSYDILLFALETKCYCAHNFCKINSHQDGVKTQLYFTLILFCSILTAKYFANK